MQNRARSILIAGIFGNALEWYDFTIYAFFVPVLANLFFPSQNPFTSLIQTFSIFAFGFLIRPFGAVLFGYIGDQIGRRKALIISIVMMSVPTLLLGFIPDYQAIGTLAPILLALLRAIQGLAVSGELTTATAFLVEHAPPNQRGVAGSFAMCSAFMGIVLSSAVAYCVTATTTDQMLYAWGWRIPFILGGIIGIIGLIIRLHTVEPALYLKTQEGHDAKKRPSVWAHLMSLNYQTVLMGIVLTSTMAIGNYFLVAYFNTFLVKYQGVPLYTAVLINFTCLCVVTILMPLFGLLSDKIGRKAVLYMGLIGFVAFAYLIFYLLQQSNLWLVFLGELLFSLSLAPIAGVIPTTLAEMFDTYNRNMGLSLSYNLSLALFGGTAPIVAMSLVVITFTQYAPALYIMISGCMGLFILSLMQESYRNPL